MRSKLVGFLALVLSACGSASDVSPASEVPAQPSLESVESEGGSDGLPLNAYFGDLHVHTRYSFDAFAFGTIAGPEEAYAFAKGETIQHPAGFDMRLDRPLDFLAVSDHGVYLGMMGAMTRPGTAAYDHPIAEDVRRADTPEERLAAYRSLFPYLTKETSPGDYIDRNTVSNAWSDIIRSANRHNAPGQFTAFIGYEYTASTPERDNLHRNVIFRTANAPVQPFTRLNSTNPEDLWREMDRWRELGIESISIPHNPNGSGGRMFEYTRHDQTTPIDPAYSELRMRNEPIVEITQVKGTSETHPALSPNDEWAGFEITDLKVASTIVSNPDGSYVRQAYRRGLELDHQGQGNPYEFGLIGSSDTHVAAGAFREDDYWSKVGLVDSTPELRSSVPMAPDSEHADHVETVSDGSGRQYQDGYFQYWGASGLAGVWAAENTREAIFSAMRRRETFATSGPRIRVRFFAGEQFDESDLTAPDLIERAYEVGVPMGGEFKAEPGDGPSFIAWAVRDPLDAPLQRLQIIKAWVDETGESSEQVFDVACSDGLAVDPQTHRCPDNGAAVNLQSCSVSDDVGADELKTVWQDPDFQATDAAAYYVRVIQNPTCRWSTWDALREGVAPREDLPRTIQDRAWSSPIWVSPDID